MRAMVTENPPLTEAEKLEFGEHNQSQSESSSRSQLVIASYNIRYARGPHLISGGLLRKTGLNNSRARARVVTSHIADAAQAFSAGRLLPNVDVLALQEAAKGTSPSVV